MRITGGIFRGRTLYTSPHAQVRPTSDKVRQAIFNILVHSDFGTGFSLNGARVADLFAGTGAMGIEALSHGAHFSLFVDDSVENRALIRKNVEALQLTGASKIWRRDATRLGPMPVGSGGPFDLVFLDPPYRKQMVSAALTSLAEGKWLAPDAFLVAETAEDEALPVCADFRILNNRVYGDTRVTFWQAAK